MDWILSIAASDPRENPNADQAVKGIPPV